MKAMGPQIAEAGYCKYIPGNHREQGHEVVDRLFAKPKY